MGSPFDMFRFRRNMFDPTQQGLTPDYGPPGSTFPQGMPGMMPPSPNMMSPSMSPSMMGDPYSEQNINSVMSQFYTPEDTARKRLDSILGNMPQRPQQISGLRKLGSALVGMGLGPEAQEKLTYAPFYREMADWKAEYEPAIKSAELERYANANERQLAYQRATTMVREQGENRRLAKSQADIARDKVKNDIAALRNQDSNWEYFEDLNKNEAYLVHPRLGKKVIGAATDFTDLEKAQWRRGDINAQIAGRERVAQLREDNERPQRDWQFRNGRWERTERIGDRNYLVPEATQFYTGDGSLPPGAGAGPGSSPSAPPKPNIPDVQVPNRGNIGEQHFPTGVITKDPSTGATQDIRIIDAQVGQLLNQNPDWRRRRWLVQDEQGNWVVPPVSRFGLDQATRARILDELNKIINAPGRIPSNQPTQQTPGRSGTTRSGTKFEILD